MADHRDDFIIAIRYALLKKGAKQKFSLFFLMMLSIFVITLDKLSVPFIFSTRAVLNDLVYQVSVITAIPGKLVNSLNQIQINHFNVINKNKILKEEIEILKNDRYNVLFLKTENKFLKEALDLGSARTINEESSIRARVLIDQESPYLKSIIIVYLKITLLFFNKRTMLTPFSV